MLRKYLVICCLTSTLVYATPREPEEIVTWQDCLIETKKLHPDLAGAAQSIRQAQADKQISQSPYLPQVSLEAAAQKRGTTAASENSSVSYGANLSQLVFDGLKTFKQIDAASAALTATEMSYRQVSAEVRQALRAAFVELMKAQDLIALSESIYARRTQNLSLVRLRYEAGREHRGSLLTAEADLLDAELEKIQAHRRILLAQTKLSKAMGREKIAALVVKEDWPTSEGKEARPDFGAMAEATPQVLVQKARQEAARFSWAATKATFFPNVSLQASLGRRGEDWDPNETEWGVGAQLSLPIFEGGRRMGEVSRDRAAYRQAMAQSESVRNHVVKNLEETWTTMVNAKEQVVVRTKFLSAAMERSKIANAQYSTGLLSFDNWVIIEDRVVAAQKAFLEAQANALLAQAQWIATKGSTVEDG